MHVRSLAALTHNGAFRFQLVVVVVVVVVAAAVIIIIIIIINFTQQSIGKQSIHTYLLHGAESLLRS